MGLYVYSSKYAPEFHQGQIGVLICSLIIIPYSYWILWAARRTPGAALGHGSGANLKNGVVVKKGDIEEEGSQSEADEAKESKEGSVEVLPAPELKA